MGRANTFERLARLDLLAIRLKADAFLTVDQLALEFGVSRRTLARDLAILRERGLPIEADRGRGGGIRLHNDWGIGRLALSYREAVDLLISVAIAEQLQSPWLMAHLAPVRRKLCASFAPGLRGRIDGLRRRILIGRAASAAVLNGFIKPQGQSLDELSRAFLEMRVLRIGYLDARSQRSTRLIEAHLLLLNYPVWYVVAWDRGRDAVRTFRCDRITAAKVEDAAFAAMPFAVFEEAIEGVEAITP